MVADSRHEGSPQESSEDPDGLPYRDPPRYFGHSKKNCAHFDLELTHGLEGRCWPKYLRGCRAAALNPEMPGLIHMQHLPDLVALTTLEGKYSALALPGCPA